MKAAIHQPQFIPYPGFFHKVSLSDTLVVMDDVQYDKRFTNRNRILGPHGPMWLTIPINKAQKFARNMEVEVNNSIPWRKEHWKKLTYFYKNAGWFDEYAPFFEEVYSKEYRRLLDLDMDLMLKVMEWLGMKAKVILESELKITGEGTQRLVDVCKAIGADCYVSGIGGRSYIDEGVFSANGVRLEYQRYLARPYHQRFSSSFVPDLSIVDMLFNLGPGTVDYVMPAEKVALSAHS